MKKFVIAFIVLLVSLILFLWLRNDSQKQSTAYQESKSSKSTVTNDKIKEPNPSKFFDGSKNKSVYDLLKEIKNNLPKDLPRSMNDVVITPGVQKYIAEYPAAGGYEKIDYKLRLFARMSNCLGDKEPSSGALLINLWFEIDRESKIGIGSDGSVSEFPEKAFQVRGTTLDSEDLSNVLNCLKTSHLDMIMDLSNMFEEVGGDSDHPNYAFMHPIVIEFPLRENEIYWILSHDGNRKPK